MFENPAMSFALATILASGGIIFAFRQLMGRVVELIEGKDDRLTLQVVTTNFFIKVAAIEVVPIVLLIYGIMQMNTFTGTRDDMIVPLFVTVAVFLFSLLVIILSARQVQNHPDVTDLFKNQTSIFMMMGIAISSTFPLIAFVMIFLSA